MRLRSDLAVLEVGDAYRLVIDGLEVSRLDWRCVELEPGEHSLAWDTRDMSRSGLASAAVLALQPSCRIELAAGHVYRVVIAFDSVARVAHTRIEDVESHRVLTESRP